MDYRIMCINRLCKAVYSLVFLSSFCFAYTPPSVDIPITFYFPSESQAETFRATQCDSNDYSWRNCGDGITCATGDPTNVQCWVDMCYHATDVNNCQGSTDPDPDPDNPDPDPDPDNPDPDNPYNFPDPSPNPDYINDGSGSNAALLAQMNNENRLLFGRLVEINEEGIKTNAHLSLSNQLLEVISGQRDFSDMAKAIDDAAWEQKQRDEAVAEGMVDQTWLLPHITAKRLRDDELLEALEFFQTSNKTQLQKIDSSLDMIESFTSETKNNTSYLGTLPEIKNMITSMYDNSYDIRRASKDTADNTEDLFDVVDDILDFVEGMDTGSTNVIEKLQEISDISQTQTDEFNARAAELQAALDAIKTNTAGGSSGGGDGGEPDDGEGDTATENSCVSFTCSSQTPACYVARKQWELDCANQTALTDSGALGDFKSELNTFLDHEDSDLENIDAGTVDTSSFMSKYTDGSGFTAGASTCPAPYTVDVVITSLTLDLTPFCDLARVIRWFLVAFATVSAGLMIAKFS
ncbi:hypothetical protein Sps_00936 [Shewanella psychrophila]|uniref:Uncharacterized protein n=1 Tax=Shewanella psychrophila TaxID=225848 RepID=A0A1S6HKR4_9GAMM|nr:virulence factor TspB C-terminal domain-related protein [Shewanella psychrophila]AQS36125.1 hypothetical protein Sps_00936 [Shewanella psychrophila]